MVGRRRSTILVWLFWEPFMLAAKLKGLPGPAFPVGDTGSFGIGEIVVHVRSVVRFIAGGGEIDIGGKALGRICLGILRVCPSHLIIL